MKVRDKKRQKNLAQKREVRANKDSKQLYKYVMKIAYDGSLYGGYAKQKHRNTIQNNIEDALQEIFNFHVATTESSRTDAKVHAISQMVMFEVDEKLNITKFKNTLNEVLNKNIRVLDIQEKRMEYHCRYEVVSKTYEYTISKVEDPRLNNYAWYIGSNLDVKRMIRASKCLIGKHDFNTFKAAKATTDTSIRTINYLNIVEEDNLIKIVINADGFLYNMVRLIVKALVDVGLKNEDEDYIEKLLDLKGKPDNLESAPAQGLCLMEIIY
ncbi:MAG: tRNA pseudouridine(38-40) synthase TruA [Erysipelotrichales bacterium]